MSASLISYINNFFNCSDILTQAAKSVSCSNKQVNYDHFRNATLACSLYDRWLKRYTNTSPSTDEYLDAEDDGESNGFDAKGRLNTIIYNYLTLLR